MANTALDVVRQIFESTKAVVSAVERRLGARIDVLGVKQESSDALLVDLAARVEALEQQRREQVE